MGGDEPYLPLQYPGPALTAKPRRIVSLVPSLTEVLYDLGLEEKVVGITKFCVHPHAWWKSKTRVGGTKNVNLDKVHQLQPDLILANREENRRDEILALADHFPVMLTDIRTIGDIRYCIAAWGKVFDRNVAADQLLQNMESGMRIPALPGLRTLYLIWKNPYMAAGNDTFIHHMLQVVGLQNALEMERYPEVSDDAIEAMQPDVVFLSSEPYPFTTNDTLLLQEKWSCPVILVDGEIFSWYGSRQQFYRHHLLALTDKLRPLCC